MKLFFHNILSSAIGFVVGIFMLISSIFILIIFTSLLASLFTNEGKIENNSVVKMTFDYQITDKPQTDPFQNLNPLTGFEVNENVHLYKTLNAIDNASKNENVTGMVLDLTNFQSPGSALLKEIRDELKNFKQSGKFIYTYATTFTQSSYYLGSVADSIFMYPKGMVALTGLSTTTPFFTETMQKIGIKPEIIRHGKFKAAVEPFMLTEMSKENRLQTEKLLQDVWSTMLKDISESRSIDLKKLNLTIDKLTITMPPKEVLKLGLIDGLTYPDQFNDILAKKLNTDGADDINFISIYEIKNTKNKSKNEIAIIYAEGGIDGNTDNIHSGYTQTIKKVLEDENIDALILRVNSPGGSALISDEILSQIKLSKKNKPIVVSMGNVAASGGYYISCAADKIIASPNTITGSIGVFGLFFTAEELLTDKLKMNYDNVKTNEFSNLGELHRSLSDEEKALIQISVKNTYNDFISHVSEGRNMTKTEVDAIGEGRVWSGLRSLNIGLIDSLGGLKDAIKIASQLAKIQDFQIKEFPKQKNSLDILLDIEATTKIKNHTVDEIYLNEIRKKILNMQGIQALLPIEYNLD